MWSSKAWFAFFTPVFIEVSDSFRGNLVNLLPLCYIIHHCQRKPRRHPLPPEQHCVPFTVRSHSTLQLEALPFLQLQETPTPACRVHSLLSYSGPGTTFPKSLIALRQAHHSSGHCLTRPAHKPSSTVINGDTVGTAELPKQEPVSAFAHRSLTASTLSLHVRHKWATAQLPAASVQCDVWSRHLTYSIINTL